MEKFVPELCSKRRRSRLFLRGSAKPGDASENQDDWLRAIDANMLTPIFLIKATVDNMIRRRFGRIVNIPSSGVKGPATYPALGLSIAARSGLTGFVAVLARQPAALDPRLDGFSPRPEGDAHAGPIPR